MRFLRCGHIVGEDVDSVPLLGGIDAHYCWSCRKFILVDSEQPESVREFVQRCEAWETDRETL